MSPVVAARYRFLYSALYVLYDVRVLAVHPDKVGHDHPGANQAAGRVNKVRFLLRRFCPSCCAATVFCVQQCLS
jgi:hypothetical protein